MFERGYDGSTNQCWRICLISNYFGPLDEGMGNAAFHIYNELSRKHRVLLLSLKDIFSLEFWLYIRKFKPHIIHYVPGPTPVSFIVTRLISLYYRNARIIMSAYGPRISGISRYIVSLLRPDLILTQSDESKEIFQKAGCKTRFLPSGVDINKFTPVTREVRDKLREKYRLPKDAYIALHIGTMRRGRNIQVLTKLQGNDCQVLIVGRTSRRPDNRLVNELRRYGCVVWVQQFENIEEIYSVSDCYLFPTVKRGNSIEIPLTVMEAMACNLPVISTRYGALSEVFEEGNGLNFVDDTAGIENRLKEIKVNNAETRTREKVIPYTWEEVTGKLEEIYSEIMKD